MLAAAARQGRSSFRLIFRSMAPAAATLEASNSAAIAILTMKPFIAGRVASGSKRTTHGVTQYQIGIGRLAVDALHRWRAIGLSEPRSSHDRYVNMPRTTTQCYRRSPEKRCNLRLLSITPAPQP